MDADADFQPLLYRSDAFQHGDGSKTGAGSVVLEGDWETVRNHPQVVASYLGSTREVIERSGTASTRVLGGARQ